MLHHQVFVSSLEAPLELQDFSPTKLAMCVWELHVLAFERKAWIDTVMRSPEQPDFKAYLARRLHQDA